MSTDYSAVCVTCRKHIHLGQRMGLGWSFGYGTGDLKTARNQGEWLMLHVNAAHEVRVVGADALYEKPLDDCECESV